MGALGTSDPGNAAPSCLVIPTSNETTRLGIGFNRVFEDFNWQVPMMRLEKISEFLPWSSEGWIKQNLNTMFYFFFFFSGLRGFFSPFSKDTRWTRNKHTFSKTSEPWHQNFLSSHTRVKLLFHTVGDSQLNWPQTWNCFYPVHSQYEVCSAGLSLALW